MSSKHHFYDSSTPGLRYQTLKPCLIYETQDRTPICPYFWATNLLNSFLSTHSSTNLLSWLMPKYFFYVKFFTAHDFLPNLTVGIFFIILCLDSLHKCHSPITCNKTYLTTFHSLELNDLFDLVSAQGTFIIENNYLFNWLCFLIGLNG